jgi:Uma2 family endonuclease
MQALEQRYSSPEEYLAWEDATDFKSEYVDGQILPVTGGTTNHNQIALNLSSDLNFAFKRLDYRVYMGGVRLWIAARRIYTYPDVTVIAGEPDYFNDREDTVTNPQVIIEVASPSTETYDRKGKFEAYRTLPSFQEYVLFDQHRVHAEQYTKTGRKRWQFQEYDTEDEAIALATIPAEIAFADIYNKGTFPPAQTHP